MADKVAVVGATGNVGREMLSVLDERAFPVSEVVALASTRSSCDAMPRQLAGPLPQNADELDDCLPQLQYVKRFEVGDSF